ncbi:polyprenyl synthetase family protein [Epidermidibacterium keratini]|uniref:Polyprenyl synthetase family protein n=1 Tax=Epidermidibacterium keratini TaxID=1891644 RepID=A0A7L4YI80_9ACTN|nr:polyprenyl synthetase family protein [Epidermidibacterium keratini]QHB99160.1 polyprenyl synthetase family protein [Epidermidibacterium keratini]
MSTPPAPPPPDVDLTAVRARIDQTVEDMVDECGARLDELSDELAPVTDAMRQYSRGGKRIRALFGYAAWRATATAASQPSEEQVLAAVSAFELVQAAALAHDDIIDASDSRRGKPSMHVGFAAIHEQAGWRGNGAEFGTHAAILAGDQLLIWADAALQRANLPLEIFAAVRTEYDAMRLEVISGQYLDVLEEVRPAEASRAEERALRVAELKAASYTIARPMRIGATLAGAPATTISTFATFGHHLGIAFQLRDDLLGVFGDPAVTGKPAGDDLREGKRTVLLARTHARTDSPPVLERVGASDLSAVEIDQLRTLMRESGAVGDVEELIEQHTALATEALARVELDPAGAAALAALTDAAVRRAA